MELLATLNALIGWGTLAMQLAIVALVIAYIQKSRDVEAIVAAWAIPAAFLLVLAGSALSLVYSMYLGIAPCPLCWMQRVFLYSQVVIFGVALFAKDARVYVYSIALSAFGALIALYQHVLQMTDGALPCPASPGASCAKRFLFELGYITFPLVACTLFVLLIVLMLFLKRAYERGTAAAAR
jgi:disulfide bond formation protein DsbB